MDIERLEKAKRLLRRINPLHGYCCEDDGLYIAERVIDDAIARQSATSEPCEWCKGVVGEYFDVLWYDFINRKRGSVNYCPNCGRRLEG